MITLLILLCTAIVFSFGFLCGSAWTGVKNFEKTSLYTKEEMKALADAGADSVCENWEGAMKGRYLDERA